jgi:hypothetical protein
VHAEQVEALHRERLEVDEAVQVALIQALHTRRGYDE